MTTTEPVARTARPLWRLAGLAALLTFASAGCDSQDQPAPVPPPVAPVLGIAFDGYELRRTTYGSDEDGLLQAGEYVVVDFFITNTSLAAYENVGITARSTGPARMLQVNQEGSSSPSIDRLGPGQSLRFVVGFEVVPNTPVGTTVPLSMSLSIRGGLSTTFDVSFVTSALPYSWATEGIAVAQDTDGDGRVEPGEEATVRFTPRRTGTPWYSSACPEYRVTSPVAQVSFPTGAPSGYCPDGVVQSFRFRASSTLTPGTVLPFVIRLRDGLGNTWDTDVSVPLG